MADAWKTLGAGDASELSSTTESIQGSLNTVASILDTIANAINLVAAFIPSEISVLGAATQALIAALEQLYEDLLHNQVAFAVHVNVNWDTSWTPDDFDESGALPWKGTGMSGWLADINTSAENPADPGSPLTDANTMVAGMIILKGITSANELTNLKRLYDAFTDFDDFKETVADIEAELERLDENTLQLARMGPILSSPIARARAKASNISEEFRESLEGAGDSALENLAAPGSLPQWANASVADVLPVTGELAKQLRAVVNNLRGYRTMADQVKKLAESLAYRATLLSNAAEELGTIIATLESLLEFFTSANVLQLDMADGGFGNFINRAYLADDLPDFGPNGIVGGVVIIATADNPWTTVQSLFDKLGLIGEASDVESSTLDDNLEATFSEVTFS